MKLHVLLATIEANARTVGNLIKEYCVFFDRKQGAFQGERGTYTAHPNTVDEPKKRSFKKIQTTVGEKLDYAIPIIGPYLKMQLDQERSNASNIATELEIGDKSYMVTTLELLRLKSWLDTSGIVNMIETIPLRSDAEIWVKSDDETYSGREGIYQSEKIESVNKTTEKESYILEDPNLTKLKDKGSYAPQIGVKNTVVTLGDQTFQKFSGEWSQTERALALKRIHDLKVVVTAALKKCNDAVVVESEINTEHLLKFIFEK